MHCIRFSSNPLIHSGLDASIGTNINGPSLIRVPDWMPDALGRYYLYFTHHQGHFIRFAYADRLQGPWRIHVPGTLHLDQTVCFNHVASPDVHMDHQQRQMRMYFHGPFAGFSGGHQVTAGQRSFAAVSDDGLNFHPRPEPLGTPYFRVFEWQGWTYALLRDPGIFEENGHTYLLYSVAGETGIAAAEIVE